MTKLYAICTKEAYAKVIENFHPQYGSHFVDLDDGRVLVIATFANESAEVVFTAVPGVEVLPDPEMAGTAQLKPDHIAAAKNLSLQGTTVLHLARAAAAIHPLMRLRPWM